MILRKWEAYSSFYLEHDQVWATERYAKGEKRILLLFPDGTELHCAVLPSKEVGFYSRINQTLVKRLKLVPDQPVLCMIKEDETEFQYVMAEELAEVLAQDEQAYAVFEKLTDGNKRSLMAAILSVKSSEKRIERALIIAESLKLGITRGQDVLKKRS
jgi:hypothetical protein